MKIIRFVPDLPPKELQITNIPIGQPFTGSFTAAYSGAGKEPVHGTFMRIKYPTSDAHYLVCLNSGFFYQLPFNGLIANYKPFEASELVLKEK
jgi:hypothetical protein